MFCNKLKKTWNFFYHINIQTCAFEIEFGWVGLWGFLWWASSAKRKDHHGVSSGLSSVWHRSNTGLSSTQYEQIPVILGVWSFWLTPFLFLVNNILAGLWLNCISSVEITLFLAATKQLYKWYFPSVCPSVRLSVCPSVTPFWLCSHHRIIMKFSGVITLDQGKVHAKDQGQRSKVKVTEVTTQLFVSGL